MLSQLFIKILLALSPALPSVQQQEPEVQEEVSVIPTVIIGGGVGGGTAAIYLSRAGFQPVVIEGANPGGALAQSDSVENWPGALKIQGAELMDNIRNQAVANGALFRNEEVVSVDFSKRPFKIQTRALTGGEIKTIQAASCIIATGSSPNYLSIPGEREYWGKGVSNCAICDGSLYKGKKVVVIGGGDSALLEALYLSNIAKEVTVLVRKDQFKGTDEKRKAAVLALPNVKVLFETAASEVKGDGHGVTGIKIAKKNAPAGELAVDGVFLAIGSKPNTALFKGKLDLDSEGYIVLKQGQQTSVPGVHAIGDAVDRLYKQAISAAGDGAKAAMAIQTELASSAPAMIAANQKTEEKSLIEAAIVEITSLAQFQEELRSTDTPIVVDFYATWCPPCKRISPKLEASAMNLAGKVKFLKVNVDDLGDLTNDYSIRSMPTVLLFDQGTIVERKVGEQQIGELLSQLEEN